MARPDRTYGLRQTGSNLRCTTDPRSVAPSRRRLPPAPATASFTPHDSGPKRPHATKSIAPRKRRSPTSCSYSRRRSRSDYTGGYEPLRGVSMSVAYESTLDISFDVRGGLLLRQIHHWAAQLQSYRAAARGTNAVSE